MRSCLLLVVLLSVASSALSARILGIFPFPGKSHQIFISSVTKNLLQRGHELVEYSPSASNTPSKNYTHFKLTSKFEEDYKNWSYEKFMEITSSAKNDFIGFGFIVVWLMTQGIMKDTFENEDIKKLLLSKDRFDLVLTESTFGQESMLVFGHKFGAPTITLQGFSTWSMMNRDAGNDMSFATIPDIGAVVATDHMSFLERCSNAIAVLIKYVMYHAYHLPFHNSLMRQYYPDETLPHLSQMVTNVSLYLVNSHPAIEYVRPYTPNIIPVGGITVSPDRVTLPQNIQKFMDEAKEGVIYFSLGTVVPAHILPNEVVQIFVNVFKSLKFKVLWKIELENIPGLSSNVLLTKWVPQPGVLAHKNCVLFITHGGLLSQQEAMYAGVPTVGIPFFGDQPTNVKLTEHRGSGVYLDFTSLSEETFSTAVNKVLKNPKYKESAARLSRVFRDRPMSPADSAVYWVEYVLRHRGAHHLRPYAAQLAWYQLALLDVLAVIIAVLVTVLWLLKKIIGWMWKSKKPVTDKKKKKN